jgi:hypothetical protein
MPQERYEAHPPCAMQAHGELVLTFASAHDSVCRDAEATPGRALPNSALQRPFGHSDKGMWRATRPGRADL